MPRRIAIARAPFKRKSNSSEQRPSAKASNVNSGEQISAESNGALRLGDAILLKLDSHNAFLTRSIGINGHGLSVVELRESEQDGDDSQIVRYPPDISDAIFTICPARKHTSALALRNLELQLDENRDGTISEEEMLATDCAATFQARLSVLRAEADSEKIINETATKHSIGTILSFGDEVQLQHRGSGEFVSSSTLPGTCDQASVTEHENPSMIFVIMPCYKANHVGDPIYLQSFFTLRALESGQYIAVTSSIPPAVMEHPHVTRQVVATVQAHNGTEFHGIVFSPVVTTAQEDDEVPLLRGGSVIELQHLQTEALLSLTAQNSIELSPKSTAKSLWRVELPPGQQDSFGGSEYEICSALLMRHFSTGQYLRSNEDGSVGLTLDNLDPGTHWCIAVSITQMVTAHEGMNVVLGQTQVLFQTHPASQSLIVSERQDEDLAKSVKGWFSGSAQDTACSESDVIVDMKEKEHPHHPSKMFKLIQVNEARFADLETARDHLVPAKKLLSLLGSNEHAHETLREYSNELRRCYNQLIKDCSKIAGSGASFRSLLAQQGAIELTVEICKVIFACSGSLKEAETEQIINGPLGFLATVVKQDPAIQAELINHIEFLHGHVDSPFKVIDTITKLMTDNVELRSAENAQSKSRLGKQVNELFVQNITQSLYNQHNTKLLGANFVTCLRVICSLNDLPLPCTQCLVMDHCLVKLMASENKPISQLQISAEGDVTISCPVIKKGSPSWTTTKWIDVASFQQHDWTCDLESCTNEEKTYRFHVETLKLLSEICRGRNVCTREWLLHNHEFFSWDLNLMLAAVANTTLPLVYRSHMLNMLSLLFLDCEPNTEVRFLNPILLSKHNTGQNFRRPSVCTKTAGYFLFDKYPELAPDLQYPELKRVVMQVCTDEAKFSDDPDLNTFSCSLLHVLGLLLRYGKFSPPSAMTPPGRKYNNVSALNELDRLIPILVQMLKTGGPSGHVVDPLLFDNAKAVTDAQLWILETIECIFSQRLNHRLHLAFHFFDSSFEEVYRSRQDVLLEGEAVCEWDETQMTSLMSQLFDTNSLRQMFVTQQMSGLRDGESVEDSNLSNDSNPYGSLFKNPDSPDRFIKVLFELTTSNSMELNIKTLRVLMAHMGEKEQLVRIMSNACLTNHSELSPTIYALEREVDQLRSSIKWLGLPPSKERAAANQICAELFPRWQQMCTPGERVVMYGEQVSTQLIVDDYVAHKMAEAFHVLRVHDYIAMIWKQQEPGDLSGMQLRQVIQDADDDGDGNIDPEEFEHLLDMLLELLLPDTEITGSIGDAIVERLVVQFKMIATEKFCELGFGGSSIIDTQALLDLTNWLMQHLEALQKDESFRQLSRSQLNRPRKEIMCNGLKLVGLMCQDSPATQRESNESLEHFMAHAANPDMEVAEFVSKMVRDSQYVIGQFDSRGIQGIVHMLSTNHDGSWLRALRYLSAPEGLPNQKTIKLIVSSLKATLRPLESHLTDPASVDLSSCRQVEWHSEFVLLLAALVNGGFCTHLMFVHKAVSLDQCVHQICIEADRTGSLASRRRRGKQGIPELRLDAESDEESLCNLPADMLSQGDVLLPEGWQMTMHTLFERYDLDASGKLESHDNLSQLTLNALVKLTLRLNMEAVDTTIANAVINASSPWDYPAFLCWFVDHIAPNQVSPKKVKKSNKPKKVKMETANDGAAAELRPYEVGSGLALKMRGAYIQLWIDAFVESNDETVVGQVHKHRKTMPTERALESTHPDSTVLDHLLGAIEFCRDNAAQLAERDELSGYLYLVVLPAIRAFFHILGPRIGTALNWKFNQVFRRALKKLLQSISVHGASEEQVETVQSVLSQMSITRDTPSLHPLEPIDQDDTDQEPDLSPMNAIGRVSYFDTLWKVYIERLATSMGLFELDDSELWFGSGIRDLSAMLSVEPCKRLVTVAQDFNPRQLLWTTFRVLSSSHETLHCNTPLMCDLIHACRAVLYLRGADSEEKRESLWNKFVCDIPLVECGSYLTRWSQWISAELGAPEVLSNLAGSTEAAVKLANIRFGTALLSGGNRKLQDILSVVINKGGSDLFSSVVVELDEAQCELMKVTDNIHIASTMELEQVEQGISALSFWKALASGYHRELQLFMGSARAGVDMFFELGDLLHDVVGVLMLCSNTTVIDIFHEVLNVLEALTGGPCKENQLKLAGSVVVAELGRLLYNLESMSSETMPHFVDEYRGLPHGTFEAAPGLTHLSEGERISIKKSIYRLFTSLLDGCDMSVAKSLLPHINTLSLLRDMFKVDAHSLYFIEQMQFHKPKALDVMEKLGGKLGEMSGLDELAKLTTGLVKGATMNEDQLQAQDETKKAIATQQQGDPKTLADKRWIAKSAYILLVSLQQYDDIGGPCDDAVALLRSEKIKEWTDYNTVLKSRVASVDITLDSNYTYRYCFIIPDICHHVRAYKSINEHIKDELDTVQRGNPLQKQVEYMDSIKERLIEIQHVKDLLDLWKLAPWTGFFTELLVNYQDIIDSAPFTLAAILVAILWITFGKADDPFGEYPMAEIVIYVVAFILFITTLLCFVKVCICTLPTKYLLKQHALDEVNRKKRLDFHKLSLHHALHGPSAPAPQPGSRPYEIPVNAKQLRDYTEWRLALDPFRIWDQPIRWWLGFAYWAVQDLPTWYYLGLNAASFIAITQRGKEMFGFCFILLDYFRRKAGQVILESVIQGAPGLIGSAKVAVVMILIFGCLGFWWFEPEINEFNDCTTSFQCIYQALDAGLHGDIAGLHGNDFEDVLLSFPVEIQKDSRKQFQFWFVTLFFLLWTYVLEGIVQGYIVDAFSTIRGTESEREDDSSTNCLVCSLSKFDLQRLGVEFDEHVEEHHNRWSYLYLANSVSIERANGWLGTTEAIVKKALEENSVDFMPLETTHEMNVNDGGEDQLDQLSGEMQERFREISDAINAMGN